MKNFNSLLAIIIVTVIVAIIQPKTTPALTGAEVREEAEKITVLLVLKDGKEFKSLGSGVMLTKDKNTFYVLTAYHTIYDLDDTELKRLRIVTYNQQRYEVKGYGKELNLDLAVLKFTSTKDYSVANYLNCDDIKAGSKVYVSGYPVSEKLPGLHITLGIISSTEQIENKPALTYDNSIAKGMSGGAVLDEKGCLVGIHRAGNLVLDKDGQRILGEDKSVALKGFKFGIPIQPNLRNIKRMISQANKNQIPPTPRPTPPPPKPEKTTASKPVELSPIFIADVCESYNKNPLENQTEALHFLQKQISENQRPIWINFIQQWRKDSSLIIVIPKDFFLTNVCLNYKPEEYKNHKQALETLQSGINKLSSEVQSEFLQIWNASEE